jgi:hypothetical protein
MAASPPSVAVIVETNAATRIRDVAARLPVWVADTPANRAAAEALAEEAPRRGAAPDVTLFPIDPEGVADDWVVRILGAVVERHGAPNRTPPLTALELYGVLVMDDLRAALSDHGFDVVTSDGDVVLAQATPAV